MYGTYSVLSKWDLGETVNPQWIVEYLDGWGRMGPLVFMVMMATAIVVSPIPSLPLDFAAGIAFGPFFGMTYAVIGAEVGAISCFLIGGFLGKDVITRLLNVDVVFCEKCTDHHLIVVGLFLKIVPGFFV